MFPKIIIEFFITRREFVEMTKCSFCGKEYDVPKGLTLVMKDGNIHYLCSAKCRKNMLMKRRKIRWIKDFKPVKRKVKKK